ncbi:MAG: DUF5668 domain-containing protein [Terracidiphilus sp.]|jgi:hypothetical protein
MSRYIMIRRLRGPAFLLLVGALALLNQTGVIGWGKSWPFFLILAGVLQLAERAALASEGCTPVATYPGTTYSGGPGAGPVTTSTTSIPAYPGQPVAYVPPQPPDSGKGGIE